MPGTALITGVTGQDGSYLAEYLLRLGYDVHGLVRRSSTSTTGRIEHLLDRPPDVGGRLHLHYGDLSDGRRLEELVSAVRPSEVYNLASQSHVDVSFIEPERTAEVTGIGCTALLEAIRRSGVQTRYFQPSSSEMFGSSPAPQSEETPFQPRSPYAAAKLYAHWIVRTYRDAYGMFAVSGIMFNHESPRRGHAFVTRKITRAVARIASGSAASLDLGNLAAVRDWGYAPEYIVAMWKMLQLDDPVDLVLATGIGLSVEEFLYDAFSVVGLRWQDHVNIDSRYLRPNEVDELIGDAARAGDVLAWKPSIHGRAVARLMVEADLAMLNSRGDRWVDTIPHTVWPL